MCRVFGFRSAFPSAVHHSLLRAKNALTVQSRQHPDGWGLAAFDDLGPHLLRGTASAFVDEAFDRAVSAISARTVIAHVRKASAGAVKVENCHPFVRDGWAFAHNGDIARWPKVQAEIEQSLPETARHFEGETDSERCFALFLILLQKERRASKGRNPTQTEPTLVEVRRALKTTVATLRALADPGAEKPSVLTIVVARRSLLAAIHSGNSLWYSTHKQRCPERQQCSFLSACCETEAKPGQPVRHLLLASEPLSTDNVWFPVPEGAVVGVDDEMCLHAPERSLILPPHAGGGI